MEYPFKEMIGIIKTEIKQQYKSIGDMGFYYEFHFDLESGEHIACIRVTKSTLKGWKVRVLGQRDEERNTFIADSVEPIADMEELRKRQLTLEAFGIRGKDI